MNSSRRVDELVLGERRVDLLDALDRADVPDVVRDRRLDLRVVDEVRPRQRGRACSAPRPGSPCCPTRGCSRRPACATRRRGSSISAMSPDQPMAATTLPFGHVLDVVVAGEPAQLTGVDGVLELLDLRQPFLLGRLGRVDSVRLQHQRDRVAHLGEHGDLALVLRVEQVVDRLRRSAPQPCSPAGRSCRSATGSRTCGPGRSRGCAGLSRRLASTFGHVGVVDLLQVAEVVHLLRHPVGDDEHAAPAGLALVEQRLDLAEELGVVVDVLGVVDRRARVLRLELRRSCCPRPCRCSRPSSRC